MKDTVPIAFLFLQQIILVLIVQLKKKDKKKFLWCVFVTLKPLMKILKELRGNRHSVSVYSSFLI